jgi:glucose/arabinose dehydrogenase
MTRTASFAVLFLLSLQQLRAGEPPLKPLVTGLTNPRSVAVGPDGRIYIAAGSDTGKEGSGTILVLDKGKAVPFVTGLDQPRGLATFQKWLFVAGKQQVWRVGANGKADVFAGRDAFPKPPGELADLVIDPESGNVYVSDTQGPAKQTGAIYRINPKGKISVVTDAERVPELVRPGALVQDGASHLLLLDSGTGLLLRIRLADGSAEKVAGGLDGLGAQPGGLAWDRHGRLYVSNGTTGQVRVIGRPGEDSKLLAGGFASTADIALDPTGKFILVTDPKAGTLTAVPARVPGAEVDERPFPLEAVVAFPELRWTGWEPVSPAGVQSPLRPIVLTHAGDGSGRVFVATQQGVIHVIPAGARPDKTHVFLDIHDRVRYSDKENEEGFLGLAFHPRYRRNRELFVFYTDRKAAPKHVNVLVRYRVHKDNPDRADPDSAEEILRIERPYWNHDGGTLCFGPDGYLYVVLGDGGAGGDPQNNGQSLTSWLGRILRIDVDAKEGGKAYAVPADNPFAGRPDARPETWAYGLRNVWRMAFDRKTGVLWAADVGQNLYEEIDLIVKGGNYGWKLREGLHPFGPKGSGPRPDLIDPIWEYHHSVGVCIIGGHVYRGSALPELDGHYIYGDFTTGKIWALRHDAAAGRVVASRPIRSPGQPMLSFGEDEAGEAYFLTTSLTGKAIYRFQRATGAP